MFNFFRKKTARKTDAAAEIPEQSRNIPSDVATGAGAVARAPTHNNDVTNEKSNARKDVVNLLIPETDYNQKTGVSAILQNIMAGKKRRHKKNKIFRAQSCREISPQKEMHNPPLQRSNSNLDPSLRQSDVTQSAEDVTAPTFDENIARDATPPPDPADFVKALVLQKYANKSPIESKKQHVSLVYVSNEPDLDEKRHAETLLREIAKSIDCTIEKINEEKELMGTTDSKTDKPRFDRHERNNNEPVYHTIAEKSEDVSINAFKNGLKGELEKLLQEQNEIKEQNDAPVEQNTDESLESPICPKKSNLKPPRSDTEGCSDDDRSDCGKKRVTFRKHIIFDDGEEQTDEEVFSSFDTVSSEEEEEEESSEGDDDSGIPDNDEMLGGVVVSRNETENKTVIQNINSTDPETGQCNQISSNETPIMIKVECNEDSFKAISSDNSDSGFLEISDKQNESGDDLSSEVKTLVVSESESEVSTSETEEEVEEEEVEVEEIKEETEVSDEEEFSIAEIIEPDDPKHAAPEKTLVSAENKFQSQVAALSDLADARCGEAESGRELISQYRKEIEANDKEIERLKCELASAYKESELVRQRSRSLEEELAAARSCSGNLADQLDRRSVADETVHKLQYDLEVALTRVAELESRLLSLEREKERLEQERRLQEQRATEALSAAEANTAKWRQAHEAARSQAAARAERMLADCEWKMRELEKRARDAEKQNKELTQSLETAKLEKSQSATHLSELSQLRGVISEQQRSVQALTLQLQRVETREEALKLEVHRLKDLLAREASIARDKEERHMQTVDRLTSQHSKALETTKAEMTAAAAASRSALERSQAERTRTAIAQLRAEAERDSRNADRKLREITTRFETLKEELASKEVQFERAIAEANSKADWELLQLRHMLDKADITYATNMDKAAEKFEKEKEQLIAEWESKVKELEEQASTDKEQAGKLLETTKMQLTAEKNDQINKLKEQHRLEMDEQWEQFMTDKESCLSRMKLECRQEGDEERVKREKELLEEIQELRSQIQSNASDFDNLAVKAAACGRTLAVTEQELREALERERTLREKRSEDATKIKKAENSAKDQVEHLTRKCACLKKLFDDMRARLMAKERITEQESRAKDKEICQLRAEVARLTKMLLQQGSPKLGARTRADGCENSTQSDESFFVKAAPQACEIQPTPPRRKGGTLRTPEPLRKRPTLPELPSLPPEARLTAYDNKNGRPRAKSVDLPAVQVPCRIRQLEEKTKE